MACRAWPEWLARHEPWAQAPETPPASIIYTSGTTGRPKGVVREAPTDVQREALKDLFSEVFQLLPGERTLIPAPMYHSAPNAYVNAAVVRGLHMTIMTAFGPEEFLRLVAEDQITVVQMVPTMFVRLLALPEQVRSRYDLSSLRWIVHAAAPCPPEVKRAMIEWLGPIVVEYYGSTEVGLITFATSEEWLERPGTVGRTLPTPPSRSSTPPVTSCHRGSRERCTCTSTSSLTSPTRAIRPSAARSNATASSPVATSATSTRTATCT